MGFPLEMGPGVFSLSVSLNNQIGPNSRVNITLQGTEDFKGLLLYAELPASTVNPTPKRFGKFENMPNGFRGLVCENVVDGTVTHNDASSKSNKRKKQGLTKTLTFFFESPPHVLYLCYPRKVTSSNSYH
jgi:hypothetical protein